MKLLEKLKNRFMGNNNQGPQELKGDGNNDAIKEIDTTMIDADKRIEKMLKEMRNEL